MNSNWTNSKEIRKLGFAAVVFFGSLSGLGLWMQKPLSTYLFGLLFILGVGFILIPHRLRPVYNAWLKVAHFLSRVMTTLILALAYYLVITPAALIRRIFVGAPLPVRPDKKASSYWMVRPEPLQPNERFLKRY